MQTSLSSHPAYVWESLKARLTESLPRGYMVSTDHDQDDSEPMSKEGFYSRAFWWMMGLGATGIAASIISTINLSIAVGKLQVEMGGVQSTMQRNYDHLTGIVENFSRDRYTSITAATDKSDYVARMSKLESRIEDNSMLITELRLWQASIKEK